MLHNRRFRRDQPDRATRYQNRNLQEDQRANAGQLTTRCPKTRKHDGKNLLSRSPALPAQGCPQHAAIVKHNRGHQQSPEIKNFQ